MFGAWLAGVLTVAVAGGDSQWHAGSPWLIDVAEDEVETLLGTPDAAGVRNGVQWYYYEKVDWLGGRQERRIEAADETVYKDQTRYLPLAATPPWLTALRDALALAGR